MTTRPSAPTTTSFRSTLAEHRTFLVPMALIGAVVIVAALAKGILASPMGTPTGPSPFAYGDVKPAPALALIDQDGKAFDLASLRGKPVLVFFGYTHCPDVCPATTGRLNEVLAKSGGTADVIFVTVDPERDTPAFLKEYLRYMPAGYVALTGSATQVRTAADAWGVRYARVDDGTLTGYAMSHTAEVYLVDATGQLRAHYPFGTEPKAMLDDLERLTAEGKA